MNELEGHGRDIEDQHHDFFSFVFKPSFCPDLYLLYRSCHLIESGIFAGKEEQHETKGKKSEDIDSKSDKNGGNTLSLCHA